MTVHHTEEQRELQRLYAALAAVDLGDADRTLLHWLAGWGPEIADAVASLLERQALAHGAPRVPAQWGQEREERRVRSAADEAARAELAARRDVEERRGYATRSGGGRHTRGGGR